MTRLMNFAGQDVGEFTGGDVPPGHWTRRDDAPNELDTLSFQDALGEARFAAIHREATSNDTVLFYIWRAAAAQKISIGESFPFLGWLEMHGVIPEGTAIELWS